MKTPISYYGGKQNLVSEILPYLEIPHERYIEPFFGGGAVFFAKPRIEFEVINDKNEFVSAFFAEMRDNFDELQRVIKNTMHCEKSHEYAKTIYNTPEMYKPIEKAWAFWVQTNMSYGTKIKGGFAFSRIRNCAIGTANKHDRFESYRNRMRTITIHNRDALKVIDMYNHETSLFYIDPPYFNSDMGHYSGYTETDFSNLLETCEEIKGLFILSSYPSNILQEFSTKNNWKTKEIKKVNAFNQSVKTEIITTNYNHQLTLFQE